MVIWWVWFFWLSLVVEETFPSAVLLLIDMYLSGSHELNCIVQEHYSSFMIRSCYFYYCIWSYVNIMKTRSYPIKILHIIILIIIIIRVYKKKINKKLLLSLEQDHNFIIINNRAYHLIFMMMMVIIIIIYNYIIIINSRTCPSLPNHTPNTPLETASHGIEEKIFLFLFFTFHPRKSYHIKKKFPVV